MEKTFQTIKSVSLNIIFFLFPLFFLPLTQEFFSTGKFYFLAFSALLLMLLSGIEIILTKKIGWKKGNYDNFLVLFIFSIAISVIVSSPNKIQALLNTSFGPVMIISLIIIYFYFSRLDKTAQITSFKVLSFSAFVLSIFTIIFFFQPFKNLDLPAGIQFLKNPTFSPVGGLVDLAIFLGFFVVAGAADIISQDESNKKNPLSIVFWIINLVALSLAVYLVVKPPVLNNQTLATILPPLRISWYAAVETLKNPLSALFGVGIDNFAPIFTKVKDVAYNQSPLWQINSFVISRSTLLHIMTEAGIFCLIGFGLLIITLIKSTLKLSDNLTLKSVLFYWLLVGLLFPPSITIWFLFFFILAINSRINNDEETSTFDLANIMPIYVGVLIIILILVGTSSYLLGRTLAAEILFKKSNDGLISNSAQQVYENQRQAIILNPFIEKYRINFSQVNLLIANNIANKINQQTTKATETTKTQISETDRQTITQAIQAAIEEGKAAVALNSQKAAGWENLALIYRNIINIAQGADMWTISAFQRAIVADPQNPRYRLSLGGVYYSLKNWGQASKSFEESVILKSDWSNAYYNLAWAYFQNNNFQLAASTMENVLKLINPTTDKADYDKVKSELEEFKKKIPKEKETSTEETQQQQTQLNVPTAIPAKIEPKIELPKSASPEAK